MTSRAYYGILALGVLIAVASVAFVAGPLGRTLLDALVLTLLLVALPVVAVAQVPLVGDVEIERLPTYWGSIFTLVLLGGLALGFGARSGGVAAVGLVGLPAPAMLGWIAALTVAGMAIIEVFRRVGKRAGVVDGPFLRALLPRTRRERSVFALLSVSAGSGEELAYRGYVIPVLTPAVGLWPAVGVSTLAFGLLHAYQGPLGIVRTAVMGATLAIGFVASGSLWPPIVAHTLIDLLAGIVLGERLLMNRGT